MGPFPFIRFEQAEINGNFGDEYAYRKTQIQVLNALFVDNYFNGDKFFIAVNEIKNEIQLLNDAPTFASLELILPSPYPTSVGVEVYTLKIGIQQNKSCFIQILFNLTDGVVTANDTTFYPGPDFLEVTTNRPFIAEELKIAKTLSVYQQNGAAIFPDTFDFDATTGIAERRLLRAYDWQYNTSSNQPQREGVTDLRMIPKTVFRLRELLQIEKAMVSFFLEKPIKESLTNDNWNSTNIYLPSLPDDWQFDFITVSSTKKQLSISSTQYELSFVLAGIEVSNKWYFQRFVNPNYTTGTPPNLATGLSGTTPSNPDTGKLYSTVYYDFDQCEFGTVVNEEPFNLLIKSGDTYQINVLKDFIFEPEIEYEILIGIFDCNGTFIQDIGTLTKPLIITCEGYKYSYTYSEGDFNSLRLDINSNILDPALYNFGLSVFQFSDEAFVYDSFQNTPADNLTDKAALINYINNLSESVYQINCVENLDLSVTVTFETNFLPCIEDDYIVNLQIKLIADDALPTVQFTKVSGGTQISTATQYQANITIPPLSNSNYFIGIYQAYGIDGQGYATLLAMSQSLALDNFEDFTQMLEYGSAQDSIIEGFEYLNGWIQRIRVPLNGAGQTYSLEESIYRNSDGTFQKPQNSTDENISLHTDYLDLQTQRAMTSATRHPIFVLANQNLSVQGDLEIATNQDYTTNQSFRKLQQMRFQAKNQGYQPNNNSCLG